MNEHEGQAISWQVETHEHRERSTDWYWGLGIGAVVAAGISLFFGNILFALIILIGLGSIATLTARGPREHWIKIESRGVSVDGTLYRYASIQSFWVQAGENPRLLLTTTGIFSPQMVIPLGNMTRAQNIRTYLKRFTTEEEQEAHLGEHLAELFGL
ncbi:MAG: protein of unknown function with transrane region [Candidatus Adlerbacteria bacterium]|nr:protein of unknown function with transrane region [Candidatus Adlerbacteria bacterium]